MAKIDVSPSVGVLTALAAQPLRWITIFGEWLDNAFDAGATRVDIDVVQERKQYRITVTDNGRGIGNLVETIRLGKHIPQGRPGLGRYGFGLKDAALVAGGGDLQSTLTIRSVQGSMLREIVMNWAECLKNGAFEIDDQRDLAQRTALPGEEGTCIIIEPVGKRLPDRSHFQAMLDELGYIYGPAIDGGKQITFKWPHGGKEKQILPAYQWPEYVEAVDETIWINGHMARVRAGLLKEGEPTRYKGMSFIHGHRVVKAASGFGCKGMDHTGIAGRIDLDHSWKLTKNKDDLVGNEDELADAVHAIIRELLIKAQARAQELSLSEFNGRAESLLNSVLAPTGDGDAEAGAKAQRGKGGKTGTTPPGNTGRRHRRANRTQAGGTFPVPKGATVRLVYDRFPDPTLGQFDYDRQSNTGVIRLNLEQPFIAGFRAEGNARAIVMAALFLLVDQQQGIEESGQRLLPSMSGSLADAMGRLLAQPITLDGTLIEDA